MRVWAALIDKGLEYITFIRTHFLSPVPNEVLLKGSKWGLEKRAREAGGQQRTTVAYNTFILN